MGARMMRPLVTVHAIESRELRKRDWIKLFAEPNDDRDFSLFLNRWEKLLKGVAQ